MSSALSLSPVRGESNLFAELPSASSDLQQDAEDVDQLFRTFSCHSLPNFHTPDVWGDPNQRWEFSVGESTFAEGRKLNRDAFKKKIQELRLETTKPFSVVLHCNEPEDEEAEVMYDLIQQMMMLQSSSCAMGSSLFDGPQDLYDKLFSPAFNSKKQCAQTPSQDNDNPLSLGTAKKPSALAPLEKAVSDSDPTSKGSTSEPQAPRGFSEQTFAPGEVPRSERPDLEDEGNKKFKQEQSFVSTEASFNPGHTSRRLKRNKNQEPEAEPT